MAGDNRLRCGARGGSSRSSSCLRGRVAPSRSPTASRRSCYPCDGAAAPGSWRRRPFLAGGRRWPPVWPAAPGMPPASASAARRTVLGETCAAIRGDAAGAPARPGATPAGELCQPRSSARLLRHPRRLIPGLAQYQRVSSRRRVRPDHDPARPGRRQVPAGQAGGTGQVGPGGPGGPGSGGWLIPVTDLLAAGFRLGRPSPPESP